jgi:hypothetical protein
MENLKNQRVRQTYSLVSDRSFPNAAGERSVRKGEHSYNNSKIACYGINCIVETDCRPVPEFLFMKIKLVIVFKTSEGNRMKIVQ